MNTSADALKRAWTDPDEAPELDQEFFAQAKLRLGGEETTAAQWRAAAQKARSGRPLGSGTKESTTIRFDRDVLNAFRATGDGWQTRMNEALRDWLTTHSLV